MASPHHSGNPSAKFIKDKHGKMIIPPKDLSIVWGNDDRYWNVPNKDNLGAAELYQVYWLEVTGLVHETRGKKKYEVGFRVSFKEDAFGWGKNPIYIMVKRGKIRWTKIYMNPNEKGEFEIKGKYCEECDDDDDEKLLYFGLYEVWSGRWKGGLNIHHAFLKELP